MASATKIARKGLSTLLRTCVSNSRVVSTRGFHYAQSLASISRTWNRPCLFVYPTKIWQVRHFGAGLEFTEEQIQQGTLEVVKLFDKVDASKVTLDAHFITDLGLDSLDVVELVMAFEDEFGIEISDEEAEKVFTVNDTVELLKKKLLK